MRKAGKIQPLPEAVDALVKDGCFLALEGFTHLIPFAAGHEVLRQGRRDLTLVRLTPDGTRSPRTGPRLPPGNPFLITPADLLVFYPSPQANSSAPDTPP